MNLNIAEVHLGEEDSYGSNIFYYHPKMSALSVGYEFMGDGLAQFKYGIFYCGKWEEFTRIKVPVENLPEMTEALWCELEGYNA